MLNTDLDPSRAAATRGDDDVAVHAVLRAGSMGAVVLAGLSTTIVVALWLAFYVLVFIPRATSS